MMITDHREKIRSNYRADENKLLEYLMENYAPDAAMRSRIQERAVQVVQEVRRASGPTLTESFLGEYGLSSEEGLALMTLAEALLRVPDNETIDDLIEDKIGPSNWRDHFGKSDSSLVNASTYALAMTRGVIQSPESRGPFEAVRGAIKRLGEPVIRAAVRQAMKELGNQFVLGEDMKQALKRAGKWRAKGATYSYDMLGEAAITQADADRYFEAYSDAIADIATAATWDDYRENPGLSIKLSALCPRYEMSQQSTAIPALAERVGVLSKAAKDANISLNIDAEEAYRLGLSMDIVEIVLSDPALTGWDGFGVVVQAFGKRASFVIDWLYAMAEKLDRRIMIRLVKGAYWDSEIKRAQMDGVPDFPVFTTKSATDISYICCAAQLLKMADRIYPQFATHNAHSVAAILEMAGNSQDFEFQRLHGMGEALHGALLRNEKARSRIYAPVGRHRELLAYLVRRLLENGANSSFVNQLANHNVPAEAIATDPFETLKGDQEKSRSKIINPQDLYLPDRTNSHGWDLGNRNDLNEYAAQRAPFQDKIWRSSPVTVRPVTGGEPRGIFNPSRPEEQIGIVIEADAQQAAHAIEDARIWDAPAATRAEILRKAADLYEQHAGEIFALLTREAGKTQFDTIAELREAVDFLRYYAAQLLKLPVSDPRGIISCISPWNFPIAIFTGQIAAALAAGNAVIAKPAEQTPLIAAFATNLLHQAGVPVAVLQLLPGSGAKVGAAITGDPCIAGVCFTGSTATAQAINRNMANGADPDAMLIAETGGLNAMIVDSTALPEQSVRDIITSAFQSAGQRCSALRMLYLHEDISERFMEMLGGAMDALRLEQPWHLWADIGPVIDRNAKDKIAAYIERMKAEGRLIKLLDAPSDGFFIGPAAVKVDGINDLEEEIFGPVLHVATFANGDLDKVVGDINSRGYGLTFGLQTRIEKRIDELSRSMKVGNIYVNRNQVGAVVGSQPFGGEGLSGTGPKAGGPAYLPKFFAQANFTKPVITGDAIDLDIVQAAINALPPCSPEPLHCETMPGPTGESNQLFTYARGTVLCLGPSAEDAANQVKICEGEGCVGLAIAPGAQGDNALDGFLIREHLAEMTGFDAVVCWSDADDLRSIRRALAGREGPLIPLINTRDFANQCHLERHVCIDSTAAGGNVSLLA